MTMLSDANAMRGARPPKAERFPPGGADVLTMAFATVVAMWSVGFIGRMPAVAAPAWMVGSLLLIVTVLGGVLTGRLTYRGGLGGAAVGFVTAFVNVLILGGSLVNEEHRAGGVAAAVAGYAVANMVVMGLAARLGATMKGRYDPSKPAANWSGRLAAVAAVAVGVMMVVGGLVTSREAGLAVRGWPDSDGVFMFMYPLSRMTGNVYYEHAHRLYGSLLGLITIVLALHLWRHDRRGFVRVLVSVAFLAVCMQGVLGGFRVAMAEGSGGVEVAASEHETGLSLWLRVAHGVFAQMYLGLMVCLAAFTSRGWKEAARVSDGVVRGGQGIGEAGGDRTASLVLVGLMIVQLFLGALVRHADAQLLTHIAAAAVVLFLAAGVGMRCWLTHGPKSVTLKRVGLALTVLVVAQLGLGVGALVGRSMSTAGEPAHGLDVLFSTAHQANGAALLSAAVLAAVFVHRLSTGAATAAPAAGTSDKSLSAPAGDASI